MTKNPEKKSAIRQLIGALFRPSARWSVFSILCLGIVLTLVGIIGFEASMAYSSTEDFCSNSCHEMTEHPYATLKNTSHFHNGSGVRPDCAACHIPKPFIPKMIRKIEASREVWGHITGIIDTPEKYAAHVPAMKAREVARLRANDSAECRNCHDVEHMIPALQSAKARQYHQAMKQNGKTCIDCHQGIAHSYPELEQTTALRQDATSTADQSTADQSTPEHGAAEHE